MSNEENQRKGFPELDQVLEVALPEIYANGFSVNLNPTDTNTIFTRDGRPVAKLNLSFTTAKSLVEILGNTIETVETKTGRSIMTSAEIFEGLSKKSDD